MDTLLIIILVTVVGILAWALLGERKEVVEEKKEPDSPEQVLRRRAADREIEEKFPDRARDVIPGVSVPPAGASMPALPSSPVQAEFQFPYPVNEIIPPSSRFRLYLRTLHNAEIYARRSEFATAISLFHGVALRISDEQVREKIQVDIDYMERYRKAIQEEEKKRSETPVLPKGMGDEIRLKIDGQLPNSITINAGDPGGLNQKELAETISSSLKDQLAAFQNELVELRKELDQDDGHEDAETSELRRELAEMRGRMEEIRRNERRDLEALRREAGEIASLRRELNRLNDRLHAMSAIPESKQEPFPAEAKFQATIDPTPILELLKSIPKQETPPPVEIPEPVIEEPPLPEQADSAETETEEQIVEEVTKKREEEAETPEEIELLKDRDREEDDGLSDEDIFEKILQDDRKKKDDDNFEIMAERDREEQSEEIRIGGEDTSKEDREFYKKLLATDKRKRRELPVLKVSYDFSRLPAEDSLSRDKNLMAYSFYKYRPLLDKANELIKKRKVKDAINYYQMVMDQNIPYEFKAMIRKNIRDLNEYLEKYLTSE